MRNIFSKIFGGYLIITIVLTSLILFFAFRSIRTVYLDYLDTDLLNLNQTLQMTFIPMLEKGGRAELDALVKSTGRQINHRITIIDTKGVVLADSQSDPYDMENHIHRPEFIMAKKNGSGQSIRYSATMKKDMMYKALALYNHSGKLVGYSRVSIYISEIDHLVEDLTVKIRNVTVLVVLIALMIIYFFSGSITNPIQKLADASIKVAEGDFDVKVNLKNKDELKNLADSFNDMTDHIKLLFGQVTDQKGKLDGIIKSLQEGFVVIDKNHNISLSNNGFKLIAKQKKVIGKSIDSMIDNAAFKKLIKKTGKKKKYLSNEMIYNDKNYLCSSNFIDSTDEIVIIIYDITQIKQLEQIKKDFVVNVSHELRTPLTAIKGFIETLEDELEPVDERDKMKRYLGIINRHTNRLINIVNDLLMLSKYEDTTARLVLSDVNIKDLTDNVLRIFEQKLSHKNLNIVCNIDDHIPNFKADAFKLEQLFINLIDNAIKYTDEGGINIRIKQDKDRLKIKLKDTGLGMPEEHLARIFERFYTVDKSRSRKLGGTGLGLSIVKHIVMLHEGDIRVESSQNEGTEFYVDIPLIRSEDKN